MARTLASIKVIKDIKPIDGADKIEVATVDGWHVVVSKTDNFKVGDKVVYIEIDSQLPENDTFAFMVKRKYRVRTISLRKQVSQGLIMPLSILPKKYQNSKEETDVTDILGITKYDPELEKEEKETGNKSKKHGKIYKYFMRFVWFRKFTRNRQKNKKSTFPDWIVKTDEKRVQNMVSAYEKYRDEQRVFSVTEKIDGCSCTMAVKRNDKGKYEYFLCSRNHILPLKPVEKGIGHYYNVSEKFDVQKVLTKIAEENKYDNLILQGEIIGSGIQKNKYHVEGCDFYAFNLIANSRVCYSTEETRSLLKGYGIKTVPLVDEGIVLPSTIDDFIEYSIGKSQIRKEQKREGLVIRDYNNNRDKQVSFKVINPKFLLDEKDD